MSVPCPGWLAPICYAALMEIGSVEDCFGLRPSGPVDTFFVSGSACYSIDYCCTETKLTEEKD